MLSVLKLCSNPIVKVISTKKNIQKSFTDSAKVVNVDKEKSEQILDAANVLTLPGVVLESDILELLDSPSCSYPVTTVVKIAAGVENSSLFDYQIVLKSNKDWERIPAELQEEYVQFPLRGMQYFFVISSDKWTPFALSPHGSVFKSVDVKDVTIRFPSGCVRKEYKIDIQVRSPNPAKQTESQDLDDVTDIVSVSPRIWVKHDEVLKFQKPIEVTLPIGSATSTEKDTNLCLVKWTEDDDLCIIDTNMSMKGDVCTFGVNGFSGLIIARVRSGSPASVKNIRLSERSKSKIRNLFDYRQGCPKDCNILIFSDTSASNSLRVEIMESTIVEKELKKLMSKKPYLHQITETMSRPISIRYGEKIKVYATEGIQLHSRYTNGYIEIKFYPTQLNNHERFEVETKEPTSNAVLTFMHREKKSHMCYFEAENWLKQRRQIPFGDTAVSLKSLQVLASQIPPSKTYSLAIELDVDSNEVENLKTQGHTGVALTTQVILQWFRNSNKKEAEMVSKLATALNMLELRKMASKLVEASKANRRLVPEDFK